jgi:hypothetical protein
MNQIKLIAFAVGALLLIGAGVVVYDKIYDRGYSASSAKHEADEAAMVKANNVAIASAEKGLREDIAALVVEKENLEDENARLDAEADKDPDAHTGGIKRGSVQRVNAIR